MKILAIYTTRTLSVLRRVQAPFSVLAARGHTFSFMEVSHFDPSLGMGHDITVLNNWVLSDEENARLAEYATNNTHFAYDLSIPDLLQIPQVRETMRLCRLISVPNAYLKREVEIAIHSSRVVVLPSTIDKEYLLLANHYKRQEKPMIGCFGMYDWGMLKEILEAVHEAHPDLLFLGDERAKKQVGEVITQVGLSLETYPQVLKQCLFLLAPIERFQGQETIGEQEFGLLCKPTLRFNAVQAKDVPHSVERIVQLLDLSDRRMLGQLAHEIAKQHSSFRLADQYLHTYRQMLPYLVRPY